MSEGVAPYLALVTSEHASQPNFTAVLTAFLQPFADGQARLQSLPGLYDVDVAAGTQLDAVGMWVNRSRLLAEPLTGIYFSFDTLGVGFDQGIWFGPYSPTSGLVPLEDTTYRALIKAVIVANQWDGSIPGAYAVMNAFFAAADAPFNSVLIQDNGDMTMAVAVMGPAPNPTLQALIQAGALDVRPAGVGIANYYGNPFYPMPFFGFDVQNTAIRGFDQGCWAVALPFTPSSGLGAFAFGFDNFFSIALMSGT